MRLSRMLTRRAGVMLGSAALVAGLGAAAMVVYVNADRLDIVDRKRSVAKTVVTVDRNAALNVIAKEGSWYKVEVGGKQGYVFSGAVADQPGTGKAQGVALSKVQSGSIPQLETAAAVKGVGEGARQYASGSGLRTTGLEELIRRSQAITPAEFEQFTTVGGLPAAAAVSPFASPTVASNR